MSRFTRSTVQRPATGSPMPGREKWFSRRNETGEANDKARAAYDAHRGPDSRRDRARTRQADALRLAPEQRLAALDSRLGVGEGAQQERSRLHAMIAARKVAPAPTANTAPSTPRSQSAPGTPKKRNKQKTAPEA